MVVVNLVLLTILGLLATTAAASTNTTLAGCPTTCGNMSIPYPFGITSGCFSQGFHLTCNQTFHPPKLFLGTNDRRSIEVTNISLEQALLYARNPIALAENPVNLPTDTVGMLFTLPASGPYTLSAEHNIFTVIGCGTLATFADPLSQDFYAICAAICRRKEVVVNGSCSGIGCCHAAIPPGITSYEIQLRRLRRLSQTQDWANTSNARAFLIWKDRFSFNQNHLSNPYLNRSSTVPIVVRWVAGKSKCEDAMKKPSKFMCRSSNSQCVNTTDRAGYICRCSNGFQGNPYLPNGCQDINECQQEIRPCDRCINTPGSFTCLSTPRSWCQWR